jgi:hypothetical protein
MEQGEKLNIILEACKELHTVEVLMKGEPAVRYVEPLGVSVSRKEEVLFVCFQTKGYSGKKDIPQYRNLIEENIVEVVTCPAYFKIPRDFNPLSKQYGNWLFHVYQFHGW